MNEYEVWVEGYSATGEQGSAQRLSRKGEDTLWQGHDFAHACESAVKELGWSIDSYDPSRNTYWGCRFFNNEMDARKSFG